MKYKTSIIIALLSFAVISSGCAVLGIKPTANVNVASPVVKINGRSIDSISKFSGTVSATVKTAINGNKEVNLKSTGVWDFLGGFGVWFLIGGIFLLAAIISAVFFKTWAFAWSSAISGLSVLAGAFFFKLFWIYIAWFTAIIVFLAFIFEVWKYRKSLTAKNIVNTVKDIADNGKLDKSYKK